MLEQEWNFLGSDSPIDDIHMHITINNSDEAMFNPKVCYTMFCSYADIEHH